MIVTANTVNASHKGLEWQSGLRSALVEAVEGTPFFFVRDTYQTWTLRGDFSVGDFWMRGDFYMNYPQRMMLLTNVETPLSDY